MHIKSFKYFQKIFIIKKDWLKFETNKILKAYFIKEIKRDNLLKHFFPYLAELINLFMFSCISELYRLDKRVNMSPFHQSLQAFH